MAVDWGSHTRKRRRRRGEYRPSLPGQLVLDSRLKGDVGLISEDLFCDLFPTLNLPDDSSSAAVCYVAIAPAGLGKLDIESALWTVAAVKPTQATSNTDSARSTIRFPIQSLGLQTILQNFQKAQINLPRLGAGSTFDIRILDVVPISLSSIYIRIDDEALTKLEMANRQFRHGGAAQVQSNWSQARRRSFQGQPPSTLSPEHWRSVIATALKERKILHIGNLLPLHVATHPITHSSPPPATVELCEPVAQGILSLQTRVVVILSSEQSRSVPPSRQYSVHSLSGPLGEEDTAEDTSNEQFFSAVEDKMTSPPSKIARSAGSAGSAGSSSGSAGSGGSVQESDTDKSITDDETDLSDGEPDTLGLSLPALLPVGNVSTLTAATPKAHNHFGSGIASPGSIISGFSISTIRPGGAGGKIFEAQGLLTPMAEELLHPKPAAEEDDEARVYVDTAQLPKIGCFAGDWIRLESAPDERLDTLGSWGLGGFETTDEEEQRWRCVKVYALPAHMSQRPRYSINRDASRLRHSFMRLERPNPKVHLSPLILANLGNPSKLRIAPLFPTQNRRSSRLNFSEIRPPTARLPPVAKDITLQKVSSPAAHDRSLDTSIKWGLEQYFKNKRRVAMNGDLIAIRIQPQQARALEQSTGAEDDPDQKDLHSRALASYSGHEDGSRKSVVWFRVNAVSTEERDDESPWGSSLLVRPDITRIVQAGVCQCKVPDAMNNIWPSYLGVIRSPASVDKAELSSRKPNVRVSPLRRRLRELFSIATSPQAIGLEMDPIAVLLSSSQRHTGKSTVVDQACLDLGLHNFVIDAYDVLSEGGSDGGDVKSAGLLESRIDRGLLSGAAFTVLTLKHIELLTAERMTSTFRDTLKRCRILVATTTKIDKISDGLRSLFTHEIEMTAPDEREREGILRDMVEELSAPVASDVDFSAIALKTAALVAGDLQDVMSRATVAQRDRVEKVAETNPLPVPDPRLRTTSRDVLLAGGESTRCVTRGDFDLAVDAARKNFADAIGAPKIPSVTWDDVGGLNNVKDAVMETIQLPLERPELFAKGMKKRSGILFYGPPGTGKTLLAKAIATEFSLNFFSVKGPELLNMYIGESEANVRRVFQRARDARPCVVFFDELDSVAPKRGNQGDSGGVMDRIVSQLLAELDGMSSGEVETGGVFVIGATNRPDLLDQALLRPGRFDKMLYLGVSETHEKQLNILKALTRKFTLHPSLSLKTIAQSLPFTYTGADLYALCSDAMLKAITRRASLVDSKIRTINARRRQAAAIAKEHEEHPHTLDSSSSAAFPAPITVPAFFDHYATPEDIDVLVEEQDFIKARDELVPSVSAKELQHYERVRKVFEQVNESKSGGEASSQTNGVGNTQGVSQADFGYEQLVQKATMLDLNGASAYAPNGTGASANSNDNEFDVPRSKWKGKGKAVMEGDFGAAPPTTFGNVGEDDAADLYDEN